MNQNLFGKLSNLIFLTSIPLAKSKIAVAEKGESIPKSSKVSKTFNSYFAPFTKLLDLFYWSCLPRNAAFKILGIIGSF